MRPNLLLMCKLLFALLVLHGFAASLQDPFLPFVSSLDLLRSTSGWFGWLLQAIFYGAGICLVFNYRVRWAAIALGLVVILALVSSKPAFRNHLFIVGCLFLLAGLHRKEEEPWMLRWQMALIYAGAFLNKVLQADWRNGQFMHQWLHTELRNPHYEFFRPHLPEPEFAIVISWVVIGSELALAALFIVRRWSNIAVGVAIVMHVAFFVLVGRRIFGHFTEDVLLAMLAFLNWPAGVTAVALKPSLQRLAGRLKSVFNWDSQFTFTAVPSTPRNWMELRVGDQPLANRAAAWYVLKHNTVLYLFAFGVFNGVAYLISHY